MKTTERQREVIIHLISIGAGILRQDQIDEWQAQRMIEAAEEIKSLMSPPTLGVAVRETINTEDKVM